MAGDGVAHDVIRGGAVGRERLRVPARVRGPATAEAAEAGLTDVSYRSLDVTAPPEPGDGDGEAAFDLIDVRFVLTHLPDPARAVANLRERRAPGGTPVRPGGFDGEVTQVARLTLEATADAIVSGGFAPADEVRQLVAELDAFAGTGGAVMSLPRIVQAWGRRS